MIAIPAKIQTFLSQLEQDGHSAYLVGGAVRDMIRSIVPKDWDIATSATPGQIKSAFKYLSDVKQIDAKFPVIIVDGVEIATYRHDIYEDVTANMTGEVIFKRVDTIEEDLGRRDLTINAIAMDKNGIIVDPYNGRDDLDKGIIRFVGNPYKRIREDPLRIFRACRFLAAISGVFEADSFEALKHSVNFGYPIKVPKERIRIEILKAMRYKDARKFFVAMHTIELLQRVFPTLDACWKADHGQYHTEDIFEHMMLAGDAAWKHYRKHCLKKPLFRLVAFLHDIGKSDPNFKDGGDGAKHFYDHEFKGAEMAEAELKALKFSISEVRYVKHQILVHMRGAEKMSPKSTRKCIKLFRELNVKWPEWLAIKHCDRLASVNKADKPLKIQKLAKKFMHELDDRPHKKDNRGRMPHHPKPCFEMKQLAISGTAVQGILGIGPSQVIGVILQYLLDRVIGDPALNTRPMLEALIVGKRDMTAINKMYPPCGADRNAIRADVDKTRSKV